MNGYYTRIHNYNFTSYLIIEMKAYEIIITDGISWRKDSSIFKHYENALDFRMRKRAEIMSRWHSENRFWKSLYADKISKIKTIEVADDYWKKDFGWSVGFTFTNNWIKGHWYRKHTEVEYLSLQLWIFKEHELIWLDQKNADVKFMKEDIEWIRHAKFPKKEEAQQFRECFFSCRRMLRRMWKEYLFGEKMRWMYEDEFNEYCERMDKLQKDLIAEMN